MAAFCYLQLTFIHNECASFSYKHFMEMLVVLMSIYERVDFYVYDFKVIGDYESEIFERIIAGRK